jgi:hypothetical protein
MASSENPGASGQADSLNIFLKQRTRKLESSSLRKTGRRPHMFLLAADEQYAEVNVYTAVAIRFHQL